MKLPLDFEIVQVGLVVLLILAFLAMMAIALIEGM